MRLFYLTRARLRRSARAERNDPEGEAGTGPTVPCRLDLPPEAIEDPVNGALLRVKDAEGVWMVFSVGRNLMDDRGDLTDDKDVGLAIER